MPAAYHRPAQLNDSAFDFLKLYPGNDAGPEAVCSALARLGYKRQEAAAEEGDFARRGEVIDVFPSTFELPLRLNFDLDKLSGLYTFEPSTGEKTWEHRMAIILPFGGKARLPAVAFGEDSPLFNFLDLKRGDYVVHNRHGIGRFLGMKKISSCGQPADHLVIEYDRGEKLYVPVEQMYLVQKYIAFQVRRPRLYRLGGRQWQRVKERARKAVRKLAMELVSLEAMRRSVKGFAYSPDGEWQKKFERSFPYRETPDQVTAVARVKQDMESGRPMDRLLCGDVGYGKTEVAMRAAFKAVMDGRQVAYLVPTTILAEQHYANFTSRLADFPFNVRMLSRFRSRGEQAGIVSEIASGAADIVIGTHRLLSEDVKFKNLGLLIIDEEQRFGVRAKEKLKMYRVSTDVLTLTATPIPRTLYMSLMNVKEMSVINTPPQNRLPVKTVVVKYDEDLVREAISAELRRGGQVYFVHNRIRDLEKLKEKVAARLPDSVRCAVGHGQMPAAELEAVVSGFFGGKFDVLFCTMIIETGIDVPRANTIIINNAHAFGLSDLHQLRGRVGRFDKQAYAYLLLPHSGAAGADGIKRVNAIEKYSQLGAGFSIAMEDLEIRGAGNVLGLEQHGFIAAVGFDLYCRLLREAVAVYKKAGVGENEIQ
ncbi:MAG: transcription-repair coupling factor [Candidatus Omnitrophica bacterium]|jgi:transcription-repair coupling factor (superfamily II helicase)|nr:transcription-repair coupling factor [Candidatus Omnitrophota bacterium]